MMSMNRRRFLLTSGLGVLGATSCFPITRAETRNKDISRFCITEYAPYYAHDAELIRQRLAVYESLGIDMIRVQTGWETGALIDELQRTSLRIKFILYVLGLPPDYGRPDEAMIDEHGVSNWHFGPWHTELEERTRKAADEQMAMLSERGIWDQIDEVCADLGPAAEGLYPANWTLGREGHEEAYWCYSPAAQADFRGTMAVRYETIDAANEAWRLDGNNAFASWEEVAIPSPGTLWARGPFWHDMLVWYRDSKRRLMRHQMDNTINVTRKYLGDQARVIVYLPGWAYTQEDWDEAVATASGPASIRLMMDNDWLMDEALRRGCLLQYTGVENANEVRRIAAKLTERGHSDCSIMWGENAGVEVAGRNPLWIAEVIASFGLRGIDYTWSNWLFEEDGITPSPTYPQFERALANLRHYYATGEIPASGHDEANVKHLDDGQYALSPLADTRIMGNYPDEIKGMDSEIAVVEGTQSQRILMRFPVDQLPDSKTVSRAVLRLTGNIDYGDRETVEIHVFRVIAPWREMGATWVRRNLRDAWSRPGGDAVGRDGQTLRTNAPHPRSYASASVGAFGPGDTMEWDVTELVSQWRTGIHPNHGMLLVMSRGATGNRSVYSREHPESDKHPVLFMELQSG